MEFRFLQEVFFFFFEYYFFGVVIYFGLIMFIELYKFRKLVMHLNSCSMDLGRDISSTYLHFSR